MEPNITGHHGFLQILQEITKFSKKLQTSGFYNCSTNFIVTWLYKCNISLRSGTFMRRRSTVFNFHRIERYD